MLLVMNYKIFCINLKRRKDRREKMEKIFMESSINNYQFFEAVDKFDVENHPYIYLFKHSNNNVHRRSFIGCALSHFSIWKELVSDNVHDIYIILEDDIRLSDNFKFHLDEYIKKIDDNMNIILIGMTVDKSMYIQSRNKYLHDTSYSIHPLTRALYGGGAFGYIITKKGAEEILNYIYINGIKIAIDYVMYNSGIPLYETHPHIVFTDAVQHSDFYVDSDIQRDYTKIIFKQLVNNYSFDDYYFYPNQDSLGNDILYAYSNILELKRIADNMENCVAFNTYGWIKNFVVQPEYFINLPNKYYSPDGIYIKKNFFINISIESIEKKIEKIQKIIKERPINIFIGKNANLFSRNIIDIILYNFKQFQIIEDTKISDIIINHITDSNHKIYINTLNILISGEPVNLKLKYDISIDTKYNSNAFKVIYYPLVFLSLSEHRKSIDPKDYLKEKINFCAFMYQRPTDNRIKYFNLLSTYKKVDALGKCCNNMNIEDTRDIYNNEITFNDIAVNHYSIYKFVLAIENTMLEGYATEKLINPLIANSLPIYWGDSKIFQYINKKRIIYIPDFSSDNELLEHIKYLDTHDDKYNEIVSENIYVDPDFTIEKFNIEIKNTISEILGFQKY